MSRKRQKLPPPIRSDFEESSGFYASRPLRTLNKGLMRIMMLQAPASNSNREHEANVGYTKAKLILERINRRYDGTYHPRGVFNDKQFNEVIGVFENLEVFGRKGYHRGYANILKHANEDFAKGYTKEKMDKYTWKLKAEKEALLEKFEASKPSPEIRKPGLSEKALNRLLLLLPVWILILRRHG